VSDDELARRPPGGRLSTVTPTPRAELAVELIRRIAGATVDPSSTEGQAVLELVDRITERNYLHRQVTLANGRAAEIERRLDTARPEMTPELLDALGVKELRLIRRPKRR
jgi:hypothetical protein